MKLLAFQGSWPDSWRDSYSYDVQEISGRVTHLGYAYSYQNRRAHTLRLLTSRLPRGARVLDVAAAQGNFSLHLAELGYDVTWNDLRADLADYVRLKYERGAISFAPGNAFDLSFPHLFDAVLITEIIEHVAHPDAFLATAARLVRPGGHIIMTTPNGAHFRNRLPKFLECSDPAVYERVQFKPNADGHIFLLHPEEIGVLAARTGLRVDEIVLFTTPLTAGHLGTEWLLRLLPQRFIRILDALALSLPLRLRQHLLLHMGVCFQRPGPTPL